MRDVSESLFYAEKCHLKNLQTMELCLRRGELLVDIVEDVSEFHEMT